MKIRYKRSAYFYLNGTSATYVSLYFAYIDETPGGVEGLLHEGLTSDYGVRIYDDHVVKIDAERPFLLFTGVEYDPAPSTLKINSQLGATYTAGQTTGNSGAGSAALIIPGLKCGDFVKITHQA